MAQSVCTFPLGTGRLVLKNLLSYRIPKISPPAAPGPFFSHQKPQNSVSCRYKQCPGAHGNSRGKHYVTPQASSRVQGQTSTSLPQNRGVEEGPNNWKSCSALARFPGDNKPHRAHGKIIQAQEKCWIWGGSQQTCIPFDLFVWNTIGDFSSSFQKNQKALLHTNICLWSM